MIAILADDLTSALDGAAPFADRGLKATVVFDSRGLADVDTDVLSLDLDSRFAAAPVAEQRFRSADALGAQSMDLAGEVEAGVPLGWLHTRRGGFCFATKAGGFGDPDALVRCVDALRTHSERAA